MKSVISTATDAISCVISIVTHKIFCVGLLNNSPNKDFFLRSGCGMSTVKVFTLINA